MGARQFVNNTDSGAYPDFKMTSHTPDSRLERRLVDLWPVFGIQSFVERNSTVLNDSNYNFTKKDKMTLLAGVLYQPIATAIAGFGVIYSISPGFRDYVGRAVEEVMKFF